MRQLDTAAIGARLTHIRAKRSQKAMAEALGVGARSYQHYERGDRDPDLRSLVGLHDEGWNVNWVLTGEGPERLTVTDAENGSQPVQSQRLTIALQLAEEALEGGHLPPPERAELVMLLYDLLETGLPEAKVLAFAKRAAA